MLIGMNTKPAPAPADAPAHSVDVNAANFESAVLKTSMDKPIIIDFWAPWCAPCRQLMPLLEKAVAARGGKLTLAKINIDENPELAQAFRIQSVPTVIALYQGAPITGFTGAKSLSEIDHMLDQVLAHAGQGLPEEMDIKTMLEAALAALDHSDLAQAQNLYSAALAQEPGNAIAYYGLVKVIICTHDFVAAQKMLDAAPEAIRKDPLCAATQKMLQMMQNAPQGDMAALERSLAQNPDDCALWFTLAHMYYVRAMKDKAVDTLITIMTRNRAWEDDKARTELLSYFDSWGFADPASVAGRKKLSKLLFS